MRLATEGSAGWVTRAEMKNKISLQSDHYPDGQNGQEYAVVDHIVEHELGALQKAGYIAVVSFLFTAV